jgi:hypothetical protein
MSKPCPCGGETYVDSFDWPKKPRRWLLRCEACRSFSALAETAEGALELSTGWSIPREWAGKTVAILASGPSMSQAAADRVRADGIPAIVVNSTFRLAPWADLLYGADAKWWQHTPRARQFAGTKVSCEPVLGVLNLRNAGKVGYSDKGGAARILLYGFDMHGSHWHGEHPKPLRATSPGTFDQWVGLMETLAAEMAKRSIEVVNCTPGSALKCFPSK